MRAGDARATLYYLLPSLLSNILPLISLPFLTRALSPSDFGLLALAQAIGLLAFGISNIGIPIAYERNYFKYKGGRGESGALFWTCTIFLSIISLIVVTVSHASKSLIDRFFFHVTSPEFLVAVAVGAAMLRGLISLGYIYLRNSSQPRAFAFLAIGEGITVFSFTLIFVIGLDLGVSGFFYAQLLATGFILVLMLVRIIGILPLRLSRHMLAEVLGLGYPLTFRSVFGVVSGQFDKYMIGLISALGQVGIYALGQRVAQVVFLLMNSLDYVFTPKVYGAMFSVKPDTPGAIPRSEVEVGREIGEYLTPFFYLACTVALLIILFSEEVLLLVADSNFHGSIEIGVILALFYASLFFGKINGRQIIFAKKTGLTLVLSVVTLVVNVILFIPFVRLWGAIGAAWAAVLGGVVYGTISFYQAQKCFRIQWETGKLAVMFGAIFFASMLQLALLQVEGFYLIRLLFKGLALGIYIVLGVWFDYLSRQRMQSIMGVLTRRLR